MLNILRTVIVANAGVFYCFSLIFLFWPYGSPWVQVVVAPLFLLSVIAQRQKAISLFLRSFSDDRADVFLMRLAGDLEFVARVVWIRNDMSSLELRAVRPLSMSARIFLTVFWPFAAANFLWEHREAWGAAVLSIEFVTISALLALNMFCGGRAEHFFAFLLASASSLLIWSLARDAQPWLNFEAALGENPAAVSAGVPVLLFHLMLRAPVRYLGEVLRIPMFLDRGIRNASDIDQLVNELRTQKGLFPTLWMRFIQNAPVVGHQIGCTDATWEKTVVASLPLVDLALIDVSRLAKGSGLEAEIAHALDAGTPVVLTCQDTCLASVSKHLEALFGDREPSGLVLWSIDADRRVTYEKAEVLEAVGGAIKERAIRSR